jgi:hypothetical protein
MWVGAGDALAEKSEEHVCYANTKISAEKSSESVCFSNANLHLQSTHAPKTLSVVICTEQAPRRVLGVPHRLVLVFIWTCCS